MALAPFRHDQGEPIQDELTETPVILRQIIDLGTNPLFRRTNRFQSAIQFCRTSWLEGELDRRVARIEAWKRPEFFAAQVIPFDDGVPTLVRRDKSQYIRRKVARLVDDHFHPIVFAASSAPMNRYVQHPDGANTFAALDSHVPGSDRRKQILPNLERRRRLAATMNRQFFF